MNWTVFMWVHVALAGTGIMMIQGTLWYIGVLLILYGIVMAEIAREKEEKNETFKGRDTR